MIDDRRQGSLDSSRSRNRSALAILRGVAAGGVTAGAACGPLGLALADSQADEIPPHKTVEDIRPLEETRNAYARRALALHHGNVHATAPALQITDRTLLTRLGDMSRQTTKRIRKAR